MEVLIEKLGPFIFLFIGFVIIFTIYVFGKAIMKLLTSITRAKFFQHKNMTRLNYLIEKKDKSGLTMTEQEELSKLSKSLGSIIDSFPMKK